MRPLSGVFTQQAVVAAGGGDVTVTSTEVTTGTSHAIAFGPTISSGDLCGSWTSLCVGIGKSMSNFFFSSLTVQDQSGTVEPIVQLGYGADLGGMRCFPDDNEWNRIVENDPVDPGSDLMISTLGNPNLKLDFGDWYDGARNGIPYQVVPFDQPLLPIELGAYAAESDPGPYPIPKDAIPEGWKIPPFEYTDGHVLVVQRDLTKPNQLGMLYELFRGFPQGDYPDNTTGWFAPQASKFDLNSNALRPSGWTSTDAAGLPVFPGLVRYDEIQRALADYALGGPGVIPHALRFTIAVGYTRRAWVHPATHQAGAGTGAELMPFGARVRMKAATDISYLPPVVQVICRTIKKYGMFQADNGGNGWVSGAPNDNFSNDDNAWMGYMKGNDLEVVQMGTIFT